MNRKTLAFILAALVALAGPAVAEVSKGYTNSYGAGGTTVKDGVQNIDNEIGTIYGHVNALYRLQAGSSTPGDADSWDVWMDTTSGAPVLKYYDGDSWENLIAAATAFSTGVTLDAGLRGHSRNMVCSRQTATLLQVTASATAPATVETGGPLYLQNDATVTVSFAGATTGVYDVVASQDGATSNFELSRQTSPYSPAAGERVVCTAKYDQVAADFVWIQSDEPMEPATRAAPEGFFHAYRTHDTETVNDGGTETIAYDVEVYDLGRASSGWYDTASGKFTPQRAGLYEITASASFAVNANAEATIWVYKNGSTEVARDSRSSSTAHRLMPRASAVVYMNGTTDYLTVSIYQNSDGNKKLQCQNTSETAFWGRFIGGVQ
jgi:hypothetical protein